MTETSLWLRWDEAQDNVGIDRPSFARWTRITFAPKSQPYVFLEVKAVAYDFVVFSGRGWTGK